MAEIDTERLKQLLQTGQLSPIMSSDPTKANVPPQQIPTSGSAPSIPSIAPVPNSAADLENRLTKLRSTDSLSDHPTTLGKIGHVLGKIGNIAGDVFAPATMALIPGTDLNRRLQINQITPQLERAKAQEEVTAERKATGERADTTERRLQQHEDFEEGKPEKPGTPDEQAIAAKQKEINPTTGKPFTAYEARIRLAQDMEDTKPDRNAAEPKTITMLDKEGGKPYLYQHDPKGNYSGDEGTGQWKKIGPAQPNATTLGIVGTMQPLLNSDGSFSGKVFNNKTGKTQEVDTSNLGGATTSSGARLANTQRNQFNTQVVNPANQTEVQYQRATSAVDAYNNDPKTGAAGMVLLAQHLGTTLGGIKGAAIGEHSQEMHANAIGLEDRLSRFMDHIATGQPLSASQVKDFYSLISETRGLQWDMVLRQGIRRGQPVDFLPEGLYRTGKNADGKTVYQRKDDKNAPIIESK
jgi:hypothetical protein